LFLTEEKRVKLINIDGNQLENSPATIDDST